MRSTKVTLQSGLGEHGGDSARLVRNEVGVDHDEAEVGSLQQELAPLRHLGAAGPQVTQGQYGGLVKPEEMRATRASRKSASDKRRAPASTPTLRPF
jgi:hypothetical protein